MNKRFSEIMYESERLSADIYKKEHESLASIFSGLPAIEGINKESFINQNNIMLFLQDCLAPLMEFCDKIDFNSIPKEIKKIGYELRADIPTHIKQSYDLNLQTIQKTLNSTVEMIPENLDEKEKTKADALILFRDRATKVLFLADKIIRTKTNLLLSRHRKHKDNINVINKDCRFSKYLDETAMNLDNDYESFSVQYNVFSLINGQVLLNNLSLYCAWFHQETYLYYYSPKSMNIDSEEFFSALTKMSDAMSAMVEQKFDSLNSKIEMNGKKQDKEFNDLNKKADQLLQGQEETQRKIVVQGDRSSRENKKLEDKITKRNQKESRNELTQMDCAIIMERIKNSFNKKKRDLLVALGKSTEIIKDVDAENIKRTIEGWDISKPSPPAGYSRRISEHEFEEWAKKREARKFENWRVKLQKKNTKKKSTDTMSEEELHAKMEQDRGNEGDFRYFDEEEGK